MPIALDERGLIPQGIHAATLDEVEALFGQYGHRGRRHSLCVKLREYIAELRLRERGLAVVVDGSFVMARVDEPGDIDVVVEMPNNWPQEPLLPFEENLLGKPAKKRYEVEVLAAPAGSAIAESRLSLYRQVKIEWCRQFGWPTDLKKGLLRVSL